MKNLLYLILASCLLFIAACSEGPTPDELAGQAAKAYYELLIQGKYDQFVDGRYQPDSIPASYRDQLIANAKMFVGQQQDEHRGLKEVRLLRAQADTANHVASAYLIFVYGDSTSEEVVVPMVEVKGVWYTR